jgi:hypothetical protein
VLRVGAADVNVAGDHADSIGSKQVMEQIHYPQVFPL